MIVTATLLLLVGRAELFLGAFVGLAVPVSVGMRVVLWVGPTTVLLCEGTTSVGDGELQELSDWSLS